MLFVQKCLHFIKCDSVYGYVVFCSHFVCTREVGVSSRNVVSRTFPHFSQSLLTPMKIQYLGYIITHNSSQLQLIEGKIEGRRSRGRLRYISTTDITTTNGIKYYQLKRAAEDRKRLRGLVINLAQETTLR